MTALFGSPGMDFTGTTLGMVALGVFIVAYAMVVSEDLIHLRKSKPVILAAGIIWVCVAMTYHAWSLADGFDLARLREHAHVPDARDVGEIVGALVGHHVKDFAELFLFLTVAMTYISAIAERNVFLRINAWLVSAGFGLRTVFWTTGLLAFVISPIADNLTTALLMGAVVVTVGRGRPRFISAACANVVIAANAGGAFSPFGDITTLMVWADGKVPTQEFLKLIPASIINWVVPAAAMHFAVPKEHPEPVQQDAALKPGWWVVTVLFLLTIATAVAFHAVLHLPPFLGMTTGLSYFFAYGYFRSLADRRSQNGRGVDVFRNVAQVEWDTLLFFFGVIMCVGGLSELGFLARASTFLYDDVGATWANISVGLISAVLDNVPVMFAVLGMDPEMSLNQWLLVTLTAGVGGSLLSVGSAAGVALMGSAHGVYTFTSHLRWFGYIAAGYALSVACHLLLWGT
ncbi:MAG: sodium:proton antiporter NhaD [Planctomycetota bacterium]